MLSNEVQFGWICNKKFIVELKITVQLKQVKLSVKSFHISNHYRVTDINN